MQLLELKCPFLCKREGLETALYEKFLKDSENVRLKERHRYYGQIQVKLELLDIDTCDLCV